MTKWESELRNKYSKQWAQETKKNETGLSVVWIDSNQTSRQMPLKSWFFLSCRLRFSSSLHYKKSKNKENTWFELLLQIKSLHLVLWVRHDFHVFNKNKVQKMILSYIIKIHNFYKIDKFTCVIKYLRIRKLL